MSAPNPPDPQRAAAEYDRLAGAAIARVVPTTEPQREVWLADRLGREASLAYNESSSLRLRGALDVEAMRTALQDLVRRHESLRATVAASGEELLVGDDPSFEVEWVDLSVADASARERAL